MNIWFTTSDYININSSFEILKNKEALNYIPCTTLSLSLSPSLSLSISRCLSLSHILLNVQVMDSVNRVVTSATKRHSKSNYILYPIQLIQKINAPITRKHFFLTVYKILLYKKLF